MLSNFPFLFRKVLPIGTLSTSISHAASSERVLVISGGLAEGLGCGLCALRRATSIFGICTRYFRCARRSMGAEGCRLMAVSLSIDGRISVPINFDINRAGRMWVFCCELLVSHDPHGIARCGRRRRCHRSMLLRDCRSVLIESQGLHPPEHISSDLLHYADDPPGHTGLPYHHVQVSRSQPCLVAQYRSMFGLEYRSMSAGRCRSTEECIRSTVESTVDIPWI
ncbi:hypothetical protein DY000_02040286 [Brassica cretica]|uniref:Secreted protein n=1 Tax=Brassica cretica TaxID=69181 RepID=A0ABQ7BMK0_BRACR|nr:hypothetical protein DY000_02040286 [Brassica cretica]